ncbi:histone-lysine N-methyltransferase SETMAR-like [Andrena cerasifolii]|uniref:histone-lysine N-methyltransferase SETMAR-like n=1 Tax=Andrena cerasifolii TaxID=2819439 RepID=UPI00403832E8
MERSEIRTIMKYEFLLGTKAPQTTRNVNSVFGSGVTTEQTVSNWFAKFRTGNFDLTNEPRGRPESKVINDELKVAVESDPSQSVYELSLKFGFSEQTILTHLAQIGKVKKLDKWVPHELSEKQKRLEACLMLLSRHKSDPFFNRIVTCDEKWIQYDNRKRSAQWLDKDELLRHTPKRNIHRKKLMVTVWWSSAGVIHYDFMKPGSTIIAETYCNQLDEMMQKLKEKQPRLVNRSTPILLHDNARPHTAKMTVAKLQELELELLHHPPYSPDLPPTDYHFFRNLDNFLIGKKFNSDNAVKQALQEFIDSRPPGFYTTALNNLPLKWQKGIDNMSAYFDE